MDEDCVDEDKIVDFWQAAKKLHAGAAEESEQLAEWRRMLRKYLPMAYPDAVKEAVDVSVTAQTAMGGYRVEVRSSALEHPLCATGEDVNEAVLSLLERLLRLNKAAEIRRASQR